jgi:predicted alpha/beta superfamily hydrolase
MTKINFLKISLLDDSNEKGNIYLTGNFNGWKPADVRYQMINESQNNYFIYLPLALIPNETLDYKYTRGDWYSVELNGSGKHTPNRKWAKGMSEPKDTVNQWLKDDDLNYTKYYPIIHDLSSKFKVPDPIKTRRISILLPWDYYSSTERYPIVYLQDGQNLFQDKSPYGNWHIDRKVARLSAQKDKRVIILAVDHTHENRLAEYTPPHVPDRAEAYGKDYIDFLKNDIIPYVDENYRTIGNPQNTIIGGSSMGGLISLYAHLAFPSVFGKGLIFSPSLWLLPNLFDWLQSNSSDTIKTKTYIYCGGRESNEMVNQVVALYHGLRALNTENEITLKINSQGEHHESYWGEEFFQSMEFIL